MLGSRIIVLDTETTGLDPETGDRIVEIGCIELDEKRKPTGRYFHEYVDPEREVPLAAVKVHGNTRENCIEQGGGQKFKDVAQRLQDFIRGATIVIHNAVFDTKFINAEFQKCGMPAMEDICKSIFCTLKYAQAKYPRQRNNLDALCKRFGIDNSARELHGALLDSEILVDVYVSLTREQKNLELTTAESTPQNIRKLVEPMPSVVVLPVIDIDDGETAEHDRMMKKINKYSGDNNLWR